jgi:hypothetical protein
MRPLSDHDIVQIWDVGQKQHPLDRALTCLAFAYPEQSLMTLAKLPLGQRNVLLLLLREQTFGSRLESVAVCPNCEDQLEFVLNTQDLRVIDIPPLADEPAGGASARSSASQDPAQEELAYTLDGLRLQFRLPTSLDEAAVIAMGETDQGRINLARRCLVSASQNGDFINLETLETNAISALAGHLSEADPQSEIVLDLACPSCGHQWPLMFEIVPYLWSEIAGYAKRLLSDVHQLARFYGWSEADILSIPKQRRQYYMELMG